MIYKIFAALLIIAGNVLVYGSPFLYHHTQKDICFLGIPLGLFVCIPIAVYLMETKCKKKEIIEPFNSSDPDYIEALKELEEYLDIVK